MGLSYDTDKINAMILPYLPKAEGLQKTVLSAMRDAVLNGGKRIRPILMYETYKLFCRKHGKEADDSEIAPFMAGMETMHSASLVHDDLPCMDNDRLRRGRPTTWVTYGEDMATLTGDAMMIETFSLMGNAVVRSTDRAAAARALAVMAEKSGIYGMTGGQVVDVENTPSGCRPDAVCEPLDREQLDFIYRLKTGALLEASMMIGAILAGADDEEVASVEKLAGDIGMAFQIRDDILDVTASEEELGKPIGSDKDSGKTTFVTLYGIDKAKHEVERYSREALDMLDEIGGDNKVLREIIEYLITRTK